MRKVPFVNGEYYHIYNRGVEKRMIFSDQYDVDRFLQSMEEFNVVNPIGSIYQNSFNSLSGPTPKSLKLVEFITYCINPNHYHFILKQVSDNGISEFMKRLGGGYTGYFNDRNKRTGSLFQGRFKSVHVNTNEYLLHLSAYVNLNNKVHQLSGPTAKLVESSWDEYMGKSTKHFCEKDIVLEQFDSILKYKDFAESSLRDILMRRNEDETFIGTLLLEEI